MADDHTTQAISCYNGIFVKEAATVNIDKLAEQGMMFTNCFCTNSICSPSRATILTGKYSHKNGVYILNQNFDSTQVTSNKVLHDAGYQTAVFGKWHLKSTPAGFDDFKVLREQGRYQDPEFVEKGVDTMVTHPGWSTDIISEMTMDFIKNRDKDKPFFIMCQYKTTHDPWASRPPFDTLFTDKEMPEPANLFDTYENRGEASKRTTLKLELMNQSTFPHKRLKDAAQMEQREFIYHQYIKAFLRCGRVLDENIGRLMSFLKEQGLDENTIVVYTADQGHFLGEHGFFSKRFMYDESMQMPLIVRWPGRINPDTRDSNLVANIDFAPTVIELAGLEIPEEMQGESLKPLLEEKTPDNWRTGIYYQYWQHLLHRDVAAHYGIRTKTHKLIYFHGQPLGQTDYPPTPPEWEFYDLVNDPHEMNNIYNEPQQQEQIKEMKLKMLDLKEKYDCTDDKYP
jgi:arylsulfatase A-like enzyme